MKSSTPPHKSSILPPNKENWMTKNPFEEFKTFTASTPDLPMDQIVQSTEAVMDRIRWGYEKLLEEEAKELVWMVQYNTIIKAYEVAEKYVKELRCGYREHS